MKTRKENMSVDIDIKTKTMITKHQKLKMFIFVHNYLIYECLKEEKNRDYIHQMISDKLNEYRIIKSFE